MFIRVELSGYGGEVVLGTVTKEIYDFWTGPGEEHFHNYFYSPDWFEDEEPDFEIPENAKIDVAWHDIDDVAHENGALFDHCHIEISEMAGDKWDSDFVRELYSGSLEDFVEKYENEVDWDQEEYPNEDEYTFYGCSAEKGDFYDGNFEIPDETFDPKKFSFLCNDVYGNELIYQVNYGDVEYIDNDGGSTTGKSLDFELIPPTE